MKRTVSLFRNGRNQALRIPREMELAGTEAIISKEGDLLIIEAATKSSIFDELAGLPPLDEADWPDPIEDFPAEPVEL